MSSDAGLQGGHGSAVKQVEFAGPQSTQVPDSHMNAAVKSARAVFWKAPLASVNAAVKTEDSADIAMMVTKTDSAAGSVCLKGGTIHHICFFRTDHTVPSNFGRSSKDSVLQYEGKFSFTGSRRAPDTVRPV